MKKIPFGLWQTPVDEEFVTHRGKISEIKWDTQNSIDTLVFSGSKDGKSFLNAWSLQNGLRELGGGYAVGGSVGYGGGDFDIRDGRILFAAGEKGLCMRNLGRSLIQELTNDRYATASPVISPNHRFIAYICSDGENDCIALLSLADKSWPVLWIKGSDFYMQPTWSSDGRYFSWVEWDHPHMAWQASRVMLAEIDPSDSRIITMRIVSGGESLPASQPQFSPDSRLLSFIRSNGEWEDLVLVDLEDGSERIVIHGERFSLSNPAFSQGVHSYDWFGDNQRILYTKIYGPKNTLWIKDIKSGSEELLEIPDYTIFHTVSVSKTEGKIAAIASSPTTFPQVICMDHNQIFIVFRTNSDDLPLEYFSKPRELSWEAKNGTTIYGLYYPPLNPNFSWQGLPPAIVRPHSGPTGKAELALYPEIQYFTSRGFGWLEVNYRGSHGYGRSYLESLNGHWGEYDVEDTITGAAVLTKMGFADPQRIFLMGSSAGGYTVYNVLIRYPDSFRAGIVLYGVTNLYQTITDTHKLELHYTDSLVGTLPEAKEKFDEWSPAFHAEKISTPIAIFQGDRDCVVSSDQSREIIAKIRSRNIFRLYEGEGHGFRKPETIRDYLLTTAKFLMEFL